MRRIRPLLLAFALLLVPVSGAAAADQSLVFKVAIAYQSNGHVPPCKFTTAQLKTAKKNLTRDLQQYQPDLEDAIDDALEKRAAWACAKKSNAGSSGSAGTPAATGGGSSGGGTSAGSAAPSTSGGGSSSTPSAATPATSTPAGTTPQPAPAVNPAPAVADDAIPTAATLAPSDGADEAPAPLLVLALMLGLLLVLGALWAAVQWMGFDPPWLARWRHASHEAGWRASAAWSEFTDWVRLGR